MIVRDHDGYLRRGDREKGRRGFLSFSFYPFLAF
jgi:hypothetical protein